MISEEFLKIPKSDVLVFLPSYMKEGYNQGVIMYGPGKRDIIIQNKLHSFHYIKGEVDYMEDIKNG